MEGTPMVSGKRLPKPNNIMSIPTSYEGDFFKWWCIFLRPFIHLTNREVDVMASFLKHRWELSKGISDPAILDAMTMSEDTKRKVMEECGISSQHLYVVMNNLRKNSVIVDNIINPRLIPNIRQDESGYFQLLVLFKKKKES
jgi:hypothetical protein